MRAFVLVFALGCSTPPRIDGSTLSVPPGAESASLAAPVRPSLPLAAAELAMSAHACEVQTDGELRCWRTVASDSNWDQKLPPAGEYVQVATGALHTCTLLADGPTRCWGFDAYGETMPPPVELARVRAGKLRSCGLSPKGELHCWGRPLAGTQPEGTFADLAMSDEHACVIDTVGQVQCWGAAVPEALAAPAGAFQQLALGPDLSCGRRVDGTLACWGDNAHGRAQPPRGTYTDLDVDAFGCAVETGGRLYCWGMEHGVPLPSEPQADVAVHDWIVCARPVEGPTDCFGPGPVLGEEDHPAFDGYRPVPDRALGQRNTLLTSDKPRKHTHRWRAHRDVYAQFSMIWPGKPKGEGWARPVLLDAAVDKQSFYAERTAPEGWGDVLAKVAWYDLTPLNIAYPGVDPADRPPPPAPPVKEDEDASKGDALPEGEEEEAPPSRDELPVRTPDEILDAIVAMHGIEAAPGAWAGHPTREASWKDGGRVATWRAILAHERVYVVVLLAPEHPHFEQLKSRFFETFRPLDPASYTEEDQAERAAMLAGWAEGEAEAAAERKKREEEERQAVIRLAERREAQIAKERAIAAGERLPDADLAMLLMLTEHLPGLHCMLWTEQQWGSIFVTATFDIEYGTVQNVRFTDIRTPWGKQVQKDPTNGCLVHAIAGWKFPEDMNTSVRYTFEFI